MVTGWMVCPCMSKSLGSPSSVATPLEILVYRDVNMTGVDFVKETKAFPGFPIAAPLACHQHILVFCLCSRRSRIWLLVAVLSLVGWCLSEDGVPSSRSMFHNGPYVPWWCR